MIHCGDHENEKNMYTIRVRVLSINIHVRILKKKKQPKPKTNSNNANKHVMTIYLNVVRRLCGASMCPPHHIVRIKVTN